MDGTNEEFGLILRIFEDKSVSMRLNSQWNSQTHQSPSTHWTIIIHSTSGTRSLD